jgi:exodeoxyribonuclease-5
MQFTLGGLAGTGKTTLLAALIIALLGLGLRVAVVCSTGKASSVLRRKGISAATTLHKLLFKSIAVMRPGKRFAEVVDHWETV